MKYRKVKYKKEKSRLESYNKLYNNSSLKKGLIATYYFKDNRIVYNYDIKNIKINTPKSYAIKIATNYFKKNYKKLINSHKDYIFCVKDTDKNIIYGPYVLYTFFGNRNKGMWHLGKYKIKK